MPEVFDVKRALTEDWKTFFYERRHEKFILPCIEGDVEIQGNWMLLNINLCMPLIKRMRPISRDKHLMLEGIYDSTSHARHMTHISRSLEDAGYSREDIGHDIIMTANNALNMCYTHLGSHIRTMDIFNIADTVLRPEAKAICTIDYGDIEDRNIKRMEKVFKDTSEKMYDYFVNDTSPLNAFRAPLLCNALKRGQFYQFVVSAGPKTDTDDQMLLRPVLGSFLSGMTGSMDLAIESRSAAKSTHYNKTEMAKTQYNNRKIHLQNSVMRYLYEGDCGSQVYLTYHPIKDTVKYFLGKWYLNGMGELTELTEERFAEVVGKTILVRDVQACLYTDGFCECCGGTITRSFSKTGNVGFLSNVNAGAPVAQQVLSTKHLTTTDAAEYSVHPDLTEILMAITNDIYLKPDYRRKKKVLAFGFQPKDVSYINDLKYVLDESQLDAAYFSEITYLHLGVLKDDGTIAKHATRTPMKSDSKIYPHLSPQVLSVIREHHEDIINQDGITWFLLRNIDANEPIMQCTVVNNSIKRFVARFTDLVTKNIEHYRSMNDFMDHLTRLIWIEGKVGTHITHISCLARSGLITNKHDFNIPVMTNPDNVMFGKLLRNIPMRSIGGLMAFQSVDVVTNKPTTYITTKRHGIFDEFMGTTDIIERDRYWPINTGSPIVTVPL